MTRKQRIQKAKAFTQANEETSGVRLVRGYIEATEQELSQKSLPFMVTGESKKQIWAIDGKGVATTRFEES